MLRGEPFVELEEETFGFWAGGGICSYCDLPSGGRFGPDSAECHPGPFRAPTKKTMIIRSPPAAMVLSQIREPGAAFSGGRALPVLLSPAALAGRWAPVRDAGRGADFVAFCSSEAM